MKRTIKIICLIVILITASVNVSTAQFGIQVGYVNSKFGSDAPLFPLGLSHYNGLEVGVAYDFQIQGGVYMNYGLLYTYGTSSEEMGLVDINNAGHYLNAPVRIGYKYPLSNAFKVFGYAGPNFTFGLAGKTSGEIVGLSRDGKWYADNSGLKRFDIKLGLGVGVQYHNFQLKGGYDWGLINAYDSDNYYARRSQFNISLVYLFNIEH